MDFESLIFEQNENIGILSINRPKALNSINSSLLDELYKAEIKTVEQLEKEEIEKAIKKYGNNTQEMKQVAKALNIGIATLYRKVKKYNINTNE